MILKNAVSEQLNQCVAPEKSQDDLYKIKNSQKFVVALYSHQEDVDERHFKFILKIKTIEKATLVRALAKDLCRKLNSHEIRSAFL